MQEICDVSSVHAWRHGGHVLQVRHGDVTALSKVLTDTGFFRTIYNLIIILFHETQQWRLSSSSWWLKLQKNSVEVKWCWTRHEYSLWRALHTVCSELEMSSNANMNSDGHDVIEVCAQSRTDSTLSFNPLKNKDKSKLFVLLRTQVSNSNRWLETYAQKSKRSFVTFSNWLSWVCTLSNVSDDEDEDERRKSRSTKSKKDESKSEKQTTGCENSSQVPKKDTQKYRWNYLGNRYHTERGQCTPYEGSHKAVAAS